VSLSKLPKELYNSLLAKVTTLGENRRLLLGIAGFPASGKSTLAKDLAKGINKDLKNKVAIVVPMDGFHRSNAELKAWGIWELKGIPDSFNPEAFVNLLTGLRENTSSTVGCPAFDRKIEEPSDNAILVQPSHKLIVIEGNYLLLANGTWGKIKPLLDETWYIESNFQKIEPRLLERHIKGGRSPEEARKKMESTDLPNARLIETTKAMADHVIPI
jgi:pantothenate kinase